MNEVSMSDILERLKSRRKDLEMSFQDLADATGMSKSTLQRYETGAIKNLPLSKLETLARALHTTPEYLMGWEDDPADYEDGDLLASVSLSYVKGCDGDVKKAIRVSQAVDNDHAREFNKVFPIGETYPVPILGRIRAGYGLTAVENIVGYIPTEHKNYGDCFWLKVEGHSMEPRIFEGDFVLIDKEAAVDSGNIVAAIVDGEDGTVKKFEKQDNAVILKPLNSACETRIFVGKEQENVKIVGRVVEIKAML